MYFKSAFQDDFCSDCCYDCGQNWILRYTYILKSDACCVPGKSLVILCCAVKLKIVYLAMYITYHRNTFNFDFHSITNGSIQFNQMRCKTFCKMENRDLQRVYGAYIFRKYRVQYNFYKVYKPHLHSPLSLNFLLSLNMLICSLYI